MEVLFVFLKWVASFAHMDEKTGSKMDLGNLVMVICPSILYSRTQDAVRDESFSAIRVTTALLENQDEFFTVPKEFLPILQDQEYFADSMELPGKEFLKKMDTYMKLKAAVSNSGFNPQMSPSIDARLPFGTMGDLTPMSTPVTAAWHAPATQGILPGAPMIQNPNQGQGQPRALQLQDDWVPTPQPPINGNVTLSHKWHALAHWSPPGV
jgi:uncharacterized protein YcgL (UPF0745 family)